MVRWLLLSFRPVPSRKDFLHSLSFVHSILRSPQIYMSGLDCSPQGLGGVALAVAVTEGKRQKVEAAPLRGEVASPLRRGGGLSAAGRERGAVWKAAHCWES